MIKVGDILKFDKPIYEWHDKILSKFKNYEVIGNVED